MATTLYFLSSAADVHLGTNNAKRNGTTTGWDSRALGTSRGGSATSQSTSTVAGATSGVEIGGSFPMQWLSPPVSADVTISGAITGNLWSSESGMNANVAINFVVEVVRATDNSLVNIVTSARTTEVAVTTRAVNNFTATPGAGVTVNRGDRLRVRVFGDDAGTMGSGFTFDFGFNGPTGGVDGDSFVTFTETFSFESAPSGTQLFLTNVQSGLSDAPTLVSDFTGADENPLSEGGNWANLNSSGSPLQRVSNGASASSATTCRSYWTPANFGPDLDAYVTVVEIINAPGISFRIQGEGGANTWDGYEIVASTSSTSINVVTNAVLTGLVSKSTSWANGDKLGVRAEGSTLQAWRQASGSSDWNLVATAVDSTYGSAGKIGLRSSNAASTLDDFYAATSSNLFTQQAWTSRGSGVVSFDSATAAGWVAPLLANEWYTRSLNAFTLGGMAQANLRGLESSAGANASFKLEIARVDADGTNASVWGYWCLSAGSGTAGEIGTSESAYTVNCSGDDLAIADGQRLRFRLFIDDTDSFAMAAGATVTFFYAGTSGGASGDSYITLPQSVTEFTPVTLVLEHGFVNFQDPGVL